MICRVDECEFEGYDIIWVTRFEVVAVCSAPRQPRSVGLRHHATIRPTRAALDDET